MRKLWLIFLAVAFLVTGCTATPTQEEVATNDMQTSSLGIHTNEKNWMDRLSDNMFYVIHNDTYYPVYTYLENAAAEEDNEYGVNLDYQVETEKMLFYTTDNEKNIPTLYPGDKLVYYSHNHLLSYITWERYYDMGYTIGVTNLLSDIGGRCYINKEDTDDNYTVLPDSELYALEKETASNILFDKIGGMQVTPDMIENGIITGTKKDTVYDVDVYTGTYYQYYSVTANYHALHAFELYASIDYQTMQDFIYEVTIPDYLLTGYYNLNSIGLVRIVREETYDEYTDFNEKLLYQSDGYWSQDDPEYVYTYTPPYCYSDYEPLNHYATDLVDAFGYKEQTEETESSVNADVLKEDVVIQESIKKEYKLLLPDNKDCKIAVTSNKGEKTGRITITYDSGKQVSETFNYVDGVYELSVKGKGEVVTLTIEGFYSGYDVILTNASLYTESQPASEATE